MCATVCRSLSGLAVLPVEWIGKNGIFIAETEELILLPSLPSLDISNWP